MERTRKQKVWETELNSKNYKYYALAKYIGSEQTWSCFFKSLKIFDKFKKYVTLINTSLKEKQLCQLLEVTIQTLNELSFYYSSETITRISFYNMNKNHYSTLKTLLEYKGLLYNHNIPEADIVDIPFDTELADRLVTFQKVLM